MSEHESGANPLAQLLIAHPLRVVLGAMFVSVLVAGISTPLVAYVLFSVGRERLEIDSLAIRVLEIVAIFVTLYLLGLLRANTKRAWGIPTRTGVVRRLGIGFIFGVASLGIGCWLLLMFEVRVVRPNLPTDAAYWLNIVWRAAISALVVGVLEEIWFRGGLFTLLNKCAGLPFAIFGGSAIYAAAHFLDVPGAITIDVSELNFMLGFEALGATISNVFRWLNIDSFVALFIAGLSLTLLRMRDADVMMCIGIHAGWVFTIKVFKKYTQILPDGPNRAFAGAYDDVIGWLVALPLLALLFYVLKFVKENPVSE